MDLSYGRVEILVNETAKIFRRGTLSSKGHGPCHTINLYLHDASSVSMKKRRPNR